MSGVKEQFLIREYDNGAREVVDMIRAHRKVIYHNTNKKNPFSQGDTVWFVRGDVVGVCPNGGVRIVYDDLYTVLPLDKVDFPSHGNDISIYFFKQKVQENLRHNPHYYDNYLLKLAACLRCKGSGVIDNAEEHSVMENEGGIIRADSVCPKCKGEKPIVNEDAVRHFFQLPKLMKVKKDDLKDLKKSVKQMRKEKVVV